MSSTFTYTVIFVVLFVFATVQVLVEELGYLEEAYFLAVGAIVVLSFIKAAFVAGWYQHLKYEPRSITYLVLTGLAAAVALTVAAAYSIT